MKAFITLIRRNPGAARFLSAVIALMTVIGLVRHVWFLWIYLPAMAACIGIVTFIDHRRGPIPKVLVWLLAVWATLHLAGGLFPNPSGDSEILYGMWLIDGVLRYDQVVHGFGIATVTAVLAHAARDTERPLFWGFILAQVVGLVNETAENLFALFVDESNVGDIVNTAWDMAWHVIGAGVATLWMVRRGIPGQVYGEGYGLAPEQAGP